MTAPELTAAAQPACPVCNRALAPTQSWCLECGAAARTRIAVTPRWRPFALVTALAAILAIVAIGFAVARLVRDSSSPGSATTTSSGASPPQVSQPITPATTPATIPPITPAAPAVTQQVTPATTPAITQPVVPTATTPTP
jgi:hypothetical protein